MGDLRALVINWAWICFTVLGVNLGREKYKRETREPWKVGHHVPLSSPCLVRLYYWIWTVRFGNGKVMKSAVYVAAVVVQWFRSVSLCFPPQWSHRSRRSGCPSQEMRWYRDARLHVQASTAAQGALSMTARGSEVAFDCYGASRDGWQN